MLTREAFDHYRAPVYTKVKRSDETYETTFGYVTDRLAERVAHYHTIENNLQLFRLVRDEIDFLLRRYHNYCIKQRHRAHYIQKNLGNNEVFEHMVPASTIRDLLIKGIITPEHACNMPTCVIDAEHDRLLREKGWASNTPDIFNFWKRYEFCFDTIGLFETHDGREVDTSNWTLVDHFEYFKHVRAA